MPRKCQKRNPAVGRLSEFPVVFTETFMPFTYPTFAAGI
jgi:hypothetical protein